VEEEKNASQILDLLKKIPPNSAGIFQLDHRLLKRE
jgi:ferritin